MRARRIQLRSLVALLVVTLLLGLPALSAAAGLCLQDANGHQYILYKVSPKIAAARARPFGGISVVDGWVRPLSGVATRNSNGYRVAIAFTLFQAEVSDTGWSISTRSQFHQIAASQADGMLNIGDSATDCFWEGGSAPGLPDCMSITVIDCTTVVLP